MRLLLCLLLVCSLIGCGDDDTAEDTGADTTVADADAEDASDDPVDAEPVDASTDVESDASMDTDTAPDASSDTGDAGADAGMDAGADTATDTAADTAPDTVRPPPTFCAPTPVYIRDVSSRSGLGRVHSEAVSGDDENIVFGGEEMCDPADPLSFEDVDFSGTTRRWVAPRDGAFRISTAVPGAYAMLVHRERDGCIEPVACQGRVAAWVDARAGDSFLISVAGNGTSYFYTLTIDIRAGAGDEVCTTLYDEDGDGAVSCADPDCATACDRDYPATSRRAPPVQCDVSFRSDLRSALNVVLEEAATTAVSTDPSDGGHSPTCAPDALAAGRYTWTAPFDGYFRVLKRGTPWLRLSLHDPCGTGGQLGCGNLIDFVAAEGDAFEFVFSATEEELEDASVSLEIYSFRPY